MRPATACTVVRASIDLDRLPGRSGRTYSQYERIIQTTTGSR